MRTLHLCEDVQNNRKKCFQLVPNDVNDVPTNVPLIIYSGGFLHMRVVRIDSELVLTVVILLVLPLVFNQLLSQVSGQLKLPNLLVLQTSHLRSNGINTVF